MADKRSSWFTKSAQQGVFMKTATLSTINRSGPTQAVTDNKKIKPSKEKYFVVGETLIGGEEVVGG